MNVVNFIKLEMSGWKKSEVIFVSILLFTIFLISLYMHDTKIATASAIFGLLYTIMAGKGKILCYFFGIIGTLCYSYLAFQNAIWGNFLLQMGYYFPMEIVGIFMWSKNLKKNSGEIIKTFLPAEKRILIFVAIFVISLIFSFVLKNLGDQFPFLDAFVTVISIFGMYLTVKRCIEQWILWTIVNFLSVIIWFEVFAQGGRTFATLLMWLIYLFLGIYFFFKWWQEIYRADKL